MGKNFLRIIFVLLIMIALPFGRASASYDEETDKFLSLINSYRASNNLGMLKVDTLLQNAANWMSDDMLENCVSKRISCSHTDSTGRSFSQRLQEFKYSAFSAGENIAWGTSGLSTAQRAFDMWKNSPGHNANMLGSSYRAIGISRTCKGSYCAWVTDFGGKVIQVFNFSLNPTTSLSTPFTPNSIAGNEVEGTLQSELGSKNSTSIPLAPSEVEGFPVPQNFPDGALIRKTGGIDVYIVKYIGAKKFKRLILSPSVFAQYGHLRWSDIRNVDQATLDSFVTSDLVRAEGDKKVYKLNSLGDTGEKRWVPTAEIFTQSGFDWDAIYQINSFDRDSYVTGVNWF